MASITRPLVLSALIGAVALAVMAHAQAVPAASDAPAATPAYGAQPGTTINERMSRMAEDFNKGLPLERGARDARESSVLRGEHGWMQQVLLAAQRGRWDIAAPVGGGWLLFVVIVLGAVSLVSRLLGRRKS